MGQALKMETFLNPQDFAFFRATMLMVSQRMNRQQLLELADHLHDEIRSRRVRGANRRSLHDSDATQ